MSRPRLSSQVSAVRGLAALALFGVFAAVFVTANVPEAVGFGADVSITAGLGFAMLGLTDQAGVASESFLAAFEIIDVVLVAALVGAVLLARREGESVLAQVRAARESDDGGED